MLFLTVLLLARSDTIADLLQGSFELEKGRLRNSEALKYGLEGVEVQFWNLDVLTRTLIEGFGGSSLDISHSVSAEKEQDLPR